MGSIVKVRRLLLPEERDFLAREAQPNNYGDDPAIMASVQVAIEFQINVDSIWKPPATACLPEKQQLYVLEVSRSLMLGFEVCFMDGSLVLGEFPRASVHICFGAIEGRTLGNWPVSYAWKGEAVPIQYVSKEDCPPDDRILPIYRSDWLDEAMRRQS